MKTSKSKCLCLIFILMMISCSAEKHYNEWVVKNNERYYYDEKGKSIKNQEMKIQGYVYYFDSTGKMKKGIQEVDGIKKYYGTNGHLVNRSQWVKENDDYYFFDYNGEMVTGWTQDEHLDYWYYLKSDGKMAKSQWVDGNYYVDENGRMLKGVSKNIGDKDYTFDNNGIGREKPDIIINLKSVPTKVYAGEVVGQLSNFELSTEKYDSEQYEIKAHFNFVVTDANYKNTSLMLQYKIFDDNGFLVMSDYCYKGPINYGDKFVFDKTICLLKKGIYNFEIVQNRYYR